MKIKKLFLMLLVACMMLALFTGCKDAPMNDDNVSPSQSSPTDPGESSAPSEDITEITEIEFWMFDFGTTGAGEKADDVVAAINELTEKEIGVRVNITWVPFTDYGTQLNLAIANKEAIDVAVFNPMTTFLSCYTTGSMSDLSTLIDEYGSDLKNVVGEEILNTTTVDGKLLGIPNYRILNSNLYMIYREDVVKKVGMVDKFWAMTTWSEYEELLKAITDDGEMYGVGNARGIMFGAYYAAGDKFSDINVWDALGDSIGMIWTDQNGNVELVPGKADVVNTYKMVADWNAKGYVYPDSSFTTEDGDTMISQGLMAGSPAGSEFGVETQKRDRMGTEVLCLEIANNYISTGNGRAWGSFIPISSTEPESAMRFLNLLYTNADLMNFFIWGIEGETYEINDAGEAQYPEGLDASTSGYHGHDFAFGNQFLCLPWFGSGRDFRERAMENFTSAPKSVYMGLAIDLSDQGTLISALSAIRDEYIYQLRNGLYTDQLYNEFMAKLDAADVTSYVDIYKAAVADWMK